MKPARLAGLVAPAANDPKRDLSEAGDVPAGQERARSFRVGRQVHRDDPFAADRPGVLQGVHGLGIEVVDQQDRDRGATAGRREGGQIPLQLDGLVLVLLVHPDQEPYEQRHQDQDRPGALCELRPGDR